MRVGLFTSTLIVSALPALSIPPAGAVAEGEGQAIVEFLGTCDASGAVPISDRLFMVTDDEDNILRIYDAETGGFPVEYFDLTTALIPQIHPGGSLAGRDIDLTGELDLEAATRIGDVSYWITSHASSKKGKLRKERFQFLALTHNSAEEGVKLLGEPYAELLDAVIQLPQLTLDSANNNLNCPADIEQTINIEGMTSRFEGGVFIGFRTPVLQGKAIVIVFKNPDKVVQGGIPDFGTVIELDLDGLGVRGMVSRQDHYIIAAGEQNSGPIRVLYGWRGEGSQPSKLSIELPWDFNPETFFSPPGRDRYMVLSDDGNRSIDGNQECKKRRDFTQKSFRGTWVRDQY